MRTQDGDRGFTLIEVVIAVAIAASLVAAVYAALVSTTRASDRQGRDADASAARARAIEVIRADLRGRIRMDGDGSDFEVETTADALLPMEGWRSARVRYAVTEEGLVREEEGVESSTQVTLLSPPVRMEFREGGAWQTRPGKETRAIRITFDDPPRLVVIR